MRSRRGWVGAVLSCAVLFVTLASTGCTHRVYDPYYHDHHHWDSSETTYYNQWVIEAHVNPHTDYHHLSKEDQHRYWEWRHNHDHDRDHDRDHDHDHDHHDHDHDHDHGHH
ncbi:MAG TPA: hypothetical protein VJ731_05680 [Terriglobales bacterium]|nr:hypothetical protein [Terriglobales bacterium]